MIYIILTIILFTIEELYFRLANHLNIIDKPNERSSHSIVTIRGGGVIFYFSILLYFVICNFNYLFFFIGLTLIAIISFLDDVYTLSNKPRLLIQIISVLLLLYEVQGLEINWFYIIIILIISVGIINAYNFMDGINGITVSYSISLIILFLFVNFQTHFIDNDLLIFTLIGLLVFAFYNFRIKAKTFAGDVGSVSIAFIILFILITMILNTGKWIYVLFLSIYGVDTVMTILRRLYLKENIFNAHRTHLYQYLGNEAKLNKLSISFFYGFIQLAFGMLIIYVSNFDIQIQIIFSIVYLILIIFIYTYVKYQITNRFKY